MADSSITAYRIPQWDRQFENNRTREVKTPTWFAQSNRLDSDWYVDISSHPNGAAHIGVYTVLCMVGSMCEPHRGTLIREDGRPHTAETLAAKTRLPLALMTEVLERLVSIERLEVIPWTPQPVIVSQPVAAPPTHTNGHSKPAPQPVPDVQQSETEFRQWCERWAEITGEDTGRAKAKAAWDKFVAPLGDRGAFHACSENYLHSGQVERHAIMDRAKWIEKNSEDGWRSRWAPSRSAKKSGAEAMTDLAHKRISEGRPAV